VSCAVATASGRLFALHASHRHGRATVRCEEGQENSSMWRRWLGRYSTERDTTTHPRRVRLRWRARARSGICAFAEMHSEQMPKASRRWPLMHRRARYGDAGGVQIGSRSAQNGSRWCSAQTALSRSRGTSANQPQRGQAIMQLISTEEPRSGSDSETDLEEGWSPKRRLARRRACYQPCYQTERNSENWRDLGALNQAEYAPAKQVSALSHPGGRRFESG
jgi:hypothetical protein